MLRQKPTILCIDDEWNQLIGYKELLEGTGYKVLAATNGGDGLEMFHSNSVDAVILDYRMPGMDGDQVAVRMKSMKSQVPIMLLSGCQGLSKTKLRCVDASLTKGQSPATLLSTLDNLLNRQSSFFHGWLSNWRSNNRVQEGSGCRWLCRVSDRYSASRGLLGAGHQFPFAHT